MLVGPDGPLGMSLLRMMILWHDSIMDTRAGNGLETPMQTAVSSILCYVFNTI